MIGTIIGALLVAALVVLISGAVVFLSGISPMIGLVGLLLMGVACVLFVAAGVLMSVRNADDRLRSLTGQEEKHGAK